MSPYPEEVDVFSVPHSRMKDLVNDYAEMIKRTNFTNDLDLKLLLESLLKTFMEFKIHEQIENQLIMNKLKHKLKQLSIKNTAVCNCHSDDQLGEMMNFIKSGYQKKTVQDRINYGLKLEKALEEFTCTFIPHMQEEEEVFQPMLLQYFSYEEIRELKKKVIQKHLAQEEALLLQEQLLKQKATSDNKGDKNGKFTKDSSVKEDVDGCRKNSPSKCERIKAEELAKDSEPVTSKVDVGCRFTNLPPELKIKVFSYLKPPDLARCSQVNQELNHLTLDSSLWTELYPVQWAMGEWEDLDSCDDDDDGACEAHDECEEEEVARYVIDDDADVDESEQTEEEEYSDIVKQVKLEAGLLRALVKYILPKAGKGVKKLVLKNSRALTNGTLNKLIQLCPNLEYLDVSQTRTSDAGLKSIGRNMCGSKLKKVILSGCVNISDATLLRLAVAQHQSPINTKRGYQHGRKDYDGDTEKCAPEFDVNAVEIKRDEYQYNLDCLCEMYYEECHVSVKGGCEISTHKCRSIDEEKDKNMNSNFDQPLTEKVNNEQVCHSCCPPSSDNESGQEIPVSAIENCVKNLNTYVGAGHSETKTELLTFSDKNCPLDTYNFKFCDTEDTQDDKSPVLLNYGLQYLSLSGCFQITDIGLRALGNIGQFPNMEHLDLSGCLQVSGVGLHALVNSCANLQPQKLYYCDNIVDGPFEDTASGCQNLECSSRVCCRNGE